MAVIISKVLVVFIYMAVGFLCNKLRILPYESTKYLIPLLITVTSPCMLFDSILSKELTDGMMANTLIALIGGTLLYGIYGFIGLFLSRKLRFQSPNEISLAMTASNNGFMGIPVTMAAFPGEILYYLIIENISLNLYLYVIGVLQLNYGDQRERKQTSFKEKIKPFIKPITIVPVVASIMLFAGIKMPAYPMEIIGTIGDVTIPLSMIVVGIQLAESDIGKALRNKALAMTSVYKLILIPLATLLIVLPLPLNNALKVGLVITMIFPTSVSSAALAQYHNKNSQVIAEAVAQTTLFSIITVPVWIIVLTQLFL